MVHRKLNRQEMMRMVYIIGNEQVEYIPYLDDKLMELELIRWSDDGHIYVVYNTKIPFCDKNCQVLEEWTD